MKHLTKKYIYIYIYKKECLGSLELCQYLQVFLHTLQKHHFGPELLKLGLEFGQHGFALRTFGTHTLSF